MGQPRKPSGNKNNNAALIKASLCTESEFTDFSQYAPYDINGFSERQFEDEIESICSLLSNPQAEWEKRKNCLFKIRGLLNNNNIFSSYRDQEKNLYFNVITNQYVFSNLCRALIVCVTDLRSILSREACITISQLFAVFGQLNQSGQTHSVYHRCVYISCRSL